MQKDVAAAFHRLGIDDPTEQARLLAVEASGTAADADVLRIALAGRGGRVLLFCSSSSPLRHRIAGVAAGGRLRHRTRMVAENDSLASVTLLVRRGRRISLAP